ncbi:MAG TPA: class I SAM-dependent methyltransferase, partial [Pyrinomonadaceae bacterium]|nr:class I SAM-dependent methyltransferase [Pyrinomonadaceae bacterium]
MLKEAPTQWIHTQDPRIEQVQRACVACGSTKARPLGVKNEFDVVACRDCDSVYTPYSPWYTSAHFYTGFYLNQDELSPPAFINQRLEEITAEFSGFRENNRLLDIGCGAGNLLQAARKHGWDAQGLEVSAGAVKHVRGLGFEVFEGELQDAAFPAQHFDVITAVELLEHLVDPKPLLHEVARILRPGGLFWTTTPHARGLSGRLLGLNWRCVWPPEHLQLFSIRGLTKLLRDAGFRQLRIKTTGGNPIEIFHAMGAAKSAPKTVDQHFDRVTTSYRLNESMMKSR